MEDTPNYNINTATGSIVFSKNWNNKLNCQFFTTFRIHNSFKFPLNAQFSISMDLGKPTEIKFNATLVNKQIYKLRDVPEHLCYLDAGMSKDNFIGMVQKMYSKYNLDLFSIDWTFLLLKKLPPR